MRPKHPLRLSLRKVTRLRTPLHLLRLKINQIMCCGQPKAANVLKVEASEWAVSTLEQFRAAGCGHCPGGAAAYDYLLLRRSRSRDRKSTRLNSSHSSISYAVFCLKKKINTPPTYTAEKCPNQTEHTHPLYDM